MHRAWVSLAQHAATRADKRSSARIKLLTYNILADALCMTEKHSYCATEHRTWGDASSGRCHRLISELASYDADVLCLQECSLRCFDQLSHALPSYTGFHHSSFLNSKDDAAVAREASTGLAIFIKASAWHPTTMTKAFRLGALDGARRHAWAFRQKLSSQTDAVLLTRLVHQQTGVSIALGNTHLHWDPRWPHLKAAQGELAARALSDFAAAAPATASPPAAVLVGDFNSVPHLQPAFLPEAVRARLPEPLPDAWRPSALYSLLSNGVLPAEHPEHPWTCAPTAPPESPAPAKKRARKAAAAEPPAGSVPYTLDAHLRLRDALADTLCKGPLPATTHADDFLGCLDYVWVDSSRVDVHEVLSMPYDVDRPETLDKIPSAHWPSDHLAVGVHLSVNKSCE